jgi:RNA polymerase sigma factor (sigma-70 family)
MFPVGCTPENPMPARPAVLFRRLAAPATDGECLRRYTAARDEAAFAELVRRNGPLVLRACRSVLRDPAAAEDAFQATFLALARNARRLTNSPCVAGWLYRVAVRSAGAIRRAEVRRRRREEIAARPVQRTEDVTWAEVCQTIDEEIARLPERYRAAILLCYVQGLTYDAAADRLGCPLGALRGRLERGRAILRRRLERLGLPAVALLAAGVPTVSAELHAATLAAVRAAPATTGKLLLGLAAVCVLAATTGLGMFPFGRSPADSPKAPNPPSRSSAAAAEPKNVDAFGDPLPPGAVRRFGTLRFRHDMIENLAFTPDSKRMVVGVRRTTLAVIDPVDGRKLAQVGPMDSNYNDEFALSPDGKHVYCIGARLIKRDLATGAKVRQFEADDCQSVAVSPDGKKVAVAREVGRNARGETAMIFDAQTGEKLVDLHPNDLPSNKRGPDVRHLAFSPDGKMVAALVSEAKEIKPGEFTPRLPTGVRLWDSTTGKTLATIAPAGDVPHTFAFISGTKLIVCLGSGGVIRLWDTEADRFARTVPLSKDDEPTGRLQVSADGKRAAVYLRGGTIVVFDVRTGKEVRRLTPGETTIGEVFLALSPDGALVASRLNDDSCVRVWEVDTGREYLADAGHRGPATLSLSADGKTLVSRGAGQVFHWNLATGEGKVRRDDVKDPDGRVTTWSSKLMYRAGRYRIEWDWMEYGPGQMVVRARDGSKLIAKTSCPEGGAVAVIHSPDGRTIAVAFLDRGGYTVLLWSPETQAEPFRLAGLPGSYQQMTFTHDGKHLIAGAGTPGNAYPTETVFVYETATGKLVRKLATHRATGHLLITADDRTLITGQWDDATVKVWDLATGKELAVLVDPGVKVPPRPRGPEMASIAGLALSADERLLAVLTEKGDSSSVSVWDTGSWKPIRFRSLAPIPARSRVITSQTSAPSLVFSRGGRSVFVAYPDSTILEWAVAGGRVAAASSDARRDELWRILADPESGYEAAWELLDQPAEAVAFLKTKLAPAVPPDAAAIRALVRQLGSDVFREREAAEKKLAALGESAVPVIREALAGDLSAEGKERAEKVIASLSGGPTTGQLQQRRAVAVLEWSDRPEADVWLQKLAAGDPADRLTKEARAVAERRRHKTGNSD